MARATEDAKDKHRVSKEKHRASKDKHRVSKDKTPHTSKGKGVTSRDIKKDNKESQVKDSPEQAKSWPTKGPMVVSPGPGEPLGPHRRWPKQETPITTMSAIPQKWNWYSDEPDLAEADVDGNIERCQERIETGIMPQMFKRRLKRYKNIKRSQERMRASQPRGLSLDVVRRLESLEAIKNYCKDKPGKVNQDSCLNIKGLKAAYRSKKIDWYNGNYFTIWQYGKLVRGPINVKKANLQDLYEEFEDKEGLWVEGLGTPEPPLLGFVQVWPPSMGGQNGFSQHSVDFALRVSGSENYQVLEFRDDTGASLPMLSLDDIRMIEETSQMKAKHMGAEQAREALGTSIFGHRYVLEVAIIDSKSHRIPMTRWVQAVFFAVDYKRPEFESSALTQRLSGSWWRHMLYTATAPDNERKLYVSNSKAEIVNQLPDVSHSMARPPDIPTALFPLSHQVMLKDQANECRANREAEGGLQREGLHPPSYMQYIEWLEGYNKNLEPGKQIQASAEGFKSYRLDQRYWTRSRDWTANNLHAPTWEEYSGWVERVNATTCADKRQGDSRPRVRRYSPTYQGYQDFKLDQANWIPQEVRDDKAGCVSQ